MVFGEAPVKEAVTKAKRRKPPERGSATRISAITDGTPGKIPKPLATLGSLRLKAEAKTKKTAAVAEFYSSLQL